MKDRKTKILVLFVFLTATCFAQDPCDLYKRINDSCGKVYAANKSERDGNKRKALYQRYILLCNDVVSAFGNCMRKNNHPPGSEKSLINTYVYANALYNAGRCNEANEMYIACLNNPYAAITKVKNITYATYISRIVNKCRNTSLPATGNTAYILEYSGKSGAFIGEIYKQLQDQGLLSNDPLTAEEQEEIIRRTVYKADSANLGSIAFNLSGSNDYVYRYPFLFLKDTASFLKQSILQEKNLDPKENQNVPRPDLNLYADFIVDRFTMMKPVFFPNLDMGDKVISFYLVGGKYDSHGLANYLRFSNKIHARAQKQVAYYMALDNSVVAWVTSGGGTLIHEMLHSIINNDFPNAPFWINEGLASLYEESDKGKPLDNYRIIYIQQAFKTKKCFIPLQELFGAGKYQFLSEEDYNLVNAYSRYFCKFIHDEFGVDKLAQVYQRLKDTSNTSPEKQFDLVCNITGKTRDQLQSAWQDYLLKKQVPLKWIGILETELNKKVDSVAASVFSCSAIPSSQEAITTFEGHRSIDLRTIERLKREREMDLGRQ